MTTQTDVAQLYTTFFNRAPDAAGLAYWVNELDAGEISLEAMARNWVDEQPEGQAKYPTSLSNADFIAAIYSNVLGRVPDADGAQYWQDQLVSGFVSHDVFVAAIIKGAHNNTSAQGLLDAKLLDYKAAVGVAYADGGINNTTLAAKVLTTVTASDESLRSSLSLVKLIPADSSLTPSLIAKFSDTLNKVASLILGATGEQADLATYLSTLGAGVTSSTNLNLLLDKIGTVATSALTDSTALDNPVALGNADVAAANPPTGGSGTPTDPTDPTPILTATSVDGVLKIAGNSTAEVRVDMTSYKVTSGAITVSISGEPAFTGVDASAYRSDSVTLAQVGAVAAVPYTNTSNWHFSIVDSVANTAGYMGVGIGDLALTATASQTVDTGETLDGAITASAITLAMAGLSSAATFSFATSGFASTEAVDVFANFAMATDKIDLTAFGLTAQDVLSIDVTGDHIVADGHYSVINGVALVRGVYQGSTAADAGSLVVWDADTTGGIKQVGVFVADGAVNASQLITGAVA